MWICHIRKTNLSSVMNKVNIFLPEHAENFIEKNTEIIEKYA